MSSQNAEQQTYWNQKAGPVWVRNQERLDAQIARHGQRVLDALDVRPGERVLDVGCGCGASTLALAEAVGAEGAVVGLDLSAPMLERAAARAAQAGLGQVSTRGGDAQDADLPSDFDVVHSRFGVMFFDDPVKAFSNLRSALRPGGRLGFVCWRPPSDNPWVTVPMAAAAPYLELPPPPAPDAPGMFGLQDGDRVQRILAEAGFADIRVVAEDVAMKLGSGTPESAADLFLEVGPVAGLLNEQDASDELRGQVRQAVLAAFQARASEGPGPDRLELGSGIWLVTATRP